MFVVHVCIICMYLYVCNYVQDLIFFSFGVLELPDNHLEDWSFAGRRVNGTQVPMTLRPGFRHTVVIFTPLKSPRCGENPGAESSESGFRWLCGRRSSKTPNRRRDNHLSIPSRPVPSVHIRPVRPRPRKCSLLLVSASFAKSILH